MFSKTSSLSRILVNRSKLILNHSNTNLPILRLFTGSNSLNFILNKSTKQTASNIIYKQNAIYAIKPSFYINLNQFHKKTNTDDGKSIIDSPAQNNSALSDELKNIVSKKIEQESNQKSSTGSESTTGSTTNSSSDDQNKSSENEKKSKLGMLFSREHGWKVSLAFITALFGGSFIYVLFSWGSPKLDENNNPIKDEFSDLPVIIQYPRRAIRAVFEYYEMMKEPSTDKLLPEPLQHPYYQPPYTLVIEMNGILLHPEWSFSTGWRYKKRPGLDYFIEQVKYPLFEVVLFTREPFMTGAPIAASLDPQQHIHFKLFRESTKFIDNNYVKDLTYMNRDPSKIIVIDWDEKAYGLQPRNALHRLKNWQGDENDTDLVHLASFLKMIAASGVSDVREVLDYYNQENDPLETFKLKQIQLIESEKERQQIESAAKQKKSAFSLFKR